MATNSNGGSRPRKRPSSSATKKAAPKKKAAAKKTAAAKKSVAAKKTAAAKKTGTNEPAPRPRAPYGQLSREDVIAAALELIDEDGIDGLTMRRLGDRLGVNAMTVYRHFDSKAAILQAVVTSEAERIRFPGPYPADIVDLSVAVALHMWDVVQDHPNLAVLLTTRPLGGDDVASRFGRPLLMARAVGVPEDFIPVFADVMNTFGLAVILREALLPFQRQQMGYSWEEEQARISAQLDELDKRGEDTTLMRKVLEHRKRPEAARESFALGMRVLIEGLRHGWPPPDASPDPFAS